MSKIADSIKSNSEGLADTLSVLSSDNSNYALSGIHRSGGIFLAVCWPERGTWHYSVFTKEDALRLAEHLIKIAK